MNRRMFLKWGSALLASLPFGLLAKDERLIMGVDRAELGSDETYQLFVSTDGGTTGSGAILYSTDGGSWMSNENAR